jgi:3-oxocholest-4-en-26-oyl-CoA dehydrogenase alpha subunit
VHLEETAEQTALRKELREYFERILTPEVRAELGDAGAGRPMFRTLVRQMGQDGYLGMGWPKEYGGGGRSPLDQFILFDEIQRAGAPYPFVTVNTVGPTLIEFGTEEQKKRYLPGILAGELNFAIGYTEPEAGTDLASLRTRAELDGDEWVINGSKVYTSGANQADYVWLACRTDADVPKHQGISMIVVPTTGPGFSWTPIVTVGGHTTTATFYADVRVPVSNLVGELNRGWQMVTTQLNHERIGLAALAGRAFRLFDETLAYVKVADNGNGGVLADIPWVQSDLARCHAMLEALKLLNWRMALDVAGGSLSSADSSSVKVLGTEGVVDVYRRLIAIVGASGYMVAGSEGASLAGDLEKMGRMAQINTFGGGVNEVQRDIVAAVGLGMTRSAR